MKIRLSLLTLLAALMLGACSPGAPAPAAPTASPTHDAAVYRKITAKQAKDMMDAAESYILLDVRTQAEYDDGHIQGALLIPDNELKARSEKELPAKDARILLYCRSGARSRGAANALVALGYTQVYDFGGIIDWPYETTKD